MKFLIGCVIVGLAMNISCTIPKRDITTPAEQQVALVASLYAGDWMSVRKILASSVSADVEWQTETGKQIGYSHTALTWVVLYGRPREGRRMLMHLLNANADPNRGWPSPLSLCIRWDRGMDIVRMLVDHGAMVDEEERQVSSLEQSRKSGRLSSYRGESALAEAARIPSIRMSKDTLMYLVEHGAFVGGVCGGDALINACKMGHIDVVRALIDNGANVNYESIAGYTPLRAAYGEMRDDTQRQEIIDLLRMQGATNMGAPVIYDEPRIEITVPPIEAAPDVPRGQLPSSWIIVRPHLDQEETSAGVSP